MKHAITYIIKSIAKNAIKIFAICYARAIYLDLSRLFTIICVMFLCHTYIQSVQNDWKKKC